jgi:hypothetical protein
LVGYIRHLQNKENERFVFLNNFATLTIRWDWAQKIDSQQTADCCKEGSVASLQLKTWRDLMGYSALSMGK